MQFNGIDGRLEENVRALSPLTTTGCDSARWRLDRLYRDSEQVIQDALRALGYYDATMTRSLRWDDDCWYAEFNIELGDPVRLRQVDIRIDGDAASDTAFLARIAVGRPASGEILDHGYYGDYKASVLRAAINAGFFDADFERSEVTVDREAHAADMTMRLASGARYRFGEVTFTEDILRKRLLQGYTDIRPGEPYSSKSINELYEALNGSSYFSSVSIKTDPLDEVGKTVPVNVDLLPAKRRIYTMGGGYSTDLGPQGRLGYTDRRINDRGHQLESRLFASTIKSELSASYRWPKRDPRREWISLVAGLQHENTDTSEHDTFKLGALRSRSIGSSWLQTHYLDYEYENYKVADEDSTSELVVLGTNWERAIGRALSRATEGHRLSLDLRGASDAIGSDTSFVQLRARARWVHSFGERTRVLARASLGLTAKEKLTELPASVRFFAGGDHSVRGYEFESLGPVDENGEVIGGSHLVDASLEFDYLLRDKWAMAVFVDSGDAFNDYDIEFNTGIGLGIRWYSPVGPIRLDIAHPLDNPDEDYRIHIGLGPDL